MPQEITAEPLPELYTDSLTRRLYANDASMYEEMPGAVCYPESAADIQQLIRAIHNARIPQRSITVRAAGTSLAGQTTGGGIIADISPNMNRILFIDASRKVAHVQPGVIRDSLNREAASYGIKFGPDTSTTNRCMIGGMIGNNSAGLYSVKYGSVRDHIIEIEAVLSDGSMAVFGPLDDAGLKGKCDQENLEGNIYREMLALLQKHKKLIQASFPHPEIIRRNTGYALDKLCEMHPVTAGGRPFNLAELLCGSEGTLAFISEAVLRMVPIEKHRVLLIPHFASLDEAMHATVDAVAFNPAAAELIDDIILKATEGNLEQRQNRFFLQGDPKCLLIIEFEGDDPEELLAQAAALAARLKETGKGYAFPLLTDADEMRRVWDLRKAGLGLLMGLGDDAKTPTFAEDTAVRVADLPAYIQDFQELQKKYETNCVFYAHASVGELHLRPSIDISNEAGRKKMMAMAEEIALLVKKYRGSLSGEHGDGRARSPYIPYVLGEEAAELLSEVKKIWDPASVFNPGKITEPKPMNAGLRPVSEIGSEEFMPVFSWKDAGGFNGALQLCNGAGACRKRSESGGTMCPSYMATLNEKDSTRGRANVFRQVFTEGITDAFRGEDVKDALALCLSCKACKSECPANVDMARMKSEYLSHWYRQNGTPLSVKLWANPVPMLKMASLFPKLSNRISQSAPGHFVAESLLNVHPKRPLPEFSAQTFSSWLKKEKATGLIRASRENKGPEIILLVDPFTDFHHPEHAIDAMEVLAATGGRLLKPVVASTGRTCISSGKPELAVPVLESLLQSLLEKVNAGAFVVGLEPSELLTLRDEMVLLLPDEILEYARNVAKKALLFEEMMEVLFEQSGKKPEFNARKIPVYVHSHCYVKALSNTSSLEKLLLKCGYVPKMADTGCCGMAGSFGYQKETYDLSMQIGNQRLFPAIRELNENTLICSHGFSCKHQIYDGTGRKTHHPAQLVKMALKNGIYDAYRG